MSPRRKTLRIPDEGPCAGHPCDDCDRCLVGDCCGSDVGEAGLPLEGSWPHQWFGQLGVLVERGGKQQCSCCGEWYASLGRHLMAHNLTADAYRAMWGLNTTQSLAGPELRALRAEMGREHGTRHLRTGTMPSGEQRSKWAVNREARAQTRIARGGQPRDANGVWVPATEGTMKARRTPKA